MIISNFNFLKASSEASLLSFYLSGYESLPGFPQWRGKDRGADGGQRLLHKGVSPLPLQAFKQRQDGH